MENNTRDILVGSILGDGWFGKLSRRTGTSIYYAKYKGDKIGYLNWLRSELKELEPSELKTVQRYKQYYFFTRARKDIGDYRKIFYPNEGRKVVPKSITKLLRSPRALAVWYQDDGTLDRRSKYHWNAMFSTYCFPHNECVLLAEVLKKNFSIDVSVCKCQMRGKMYYRLYVLSKSMMRFLKIIEPYIHSSFRYKIAFITGQQ